MHIYFLVLVVLFFFQGLLLLIKFIWCITRGKKLHKKIVWIGLSHKNSKKTCKNTHVLWSLKGKGRTLRWPFVHTIRKEITCVFFQNVWVLHSFLSCRSIVFLYLVCVGHKRSCHARATLIRRLNLHGFFLTKNTRLNSTVSSCWKETELFMVWFFFTQVTKKRYL